MVFHLGRLSRHRKKISGNDAHGRAHRIDVRARAMYSLRMSFCTVPKVLRGWRLVFLRRHVKTKKNRGGGVDGHRSRDFSSGIHRKRIFMSSMESMARRPCRLHEWRGWSESGNLRRQVNATERRLTLVQKIAVTLVGFRALAKPAYWRMVQKRRGTWWDKCRGCREIGGIADGFLWFVEDNFRPCRAVQGASRRGW